MISKEEAIQIVNDSLDELNKKVGNDYAYHGCTHLVKIIIRKLQEDIQLLHIKTNKDEK